MDELLANAECLQFSGSKIDENEMKKMLNHAKAAVETLYFKCSLKNLIHPFLGIAEKFSALCQLSIGYYCNERENDSFLSFTAALERWTSVDCKAELPSLKKLKLYFDGRSQVWHHNVININSEDLFRNYMAIGNVLLKYKRTLRVVHIERVFNGGFQFITRAQHQQQWTERRKDLEALGELRRHRLKICTTDNNGRPSEFESFGTPSKMKDVLFEMLIGPLNHAPMLTAILESFQKLQNIYLTRVRIGLILWDDLDEALSIDLGVFRTCRNLRELQLRIVPKRQPGKVVVKNLESLPKGISSLRMEPNKELGYNAAKQILLNRQQMLWIIRNLPMLETFRACLPIQEETNANEEGENAGQQAEGINELANMDLEIFCKLIAMPRLKDFQVDLIRARPLDIIIARDWPAARTTQYTDFPDIKKYVELCQAAGLRASTTPTSNLGFSAYGYAKVTIQK